MQNVAQKSTSDNPLTGRISVNHHDIGNLPSTPHSLLSSPVKSETDTYSERKRYMSLSSDSEEDSVSEVDSFVIDQDYEEDSTVDAAKYLLGQESLRPVDPEAKVRLEALLHAADEAAAALTRMRSDTSLPHSEKTSIVEATVDGDVRTVRKLLGEGRSVHETSEEGESLLSLACSAGYFELAQVLLAMQANVEDRGIKGECTPLMEASSAGHLDIVRLLVAHGADVNAQSSSGNTPLMYGCAGGHADVVKFLIEHGAHVEDHNENGHTPLMEAASAGHVELAKLLLMSGAGINTHSNEFKESALTLACYKGHLDMVRFLLEAGADQEHKTDEMHTALMEASMDGHVEVAKLLLDSGAQVNMPTDSFESPLTLAACGGHVDLAMLLIERGANIEEVNDEGYTPLMEAAREGHEEMVALLLSQGAIINAQTDETQETALTLACCGGFNDVADFLIKAGADLELGASTPLMEAAQEGHLELVRYLLENNANVQAQTQTGDTALTYACENGHTDVAELLLQFSSDLEHESEGGRTPLMKACRAGHLCTVQFLITKNADVNRQTTNNDHTPLSLACAGGHLPVVELLLGNQADANHKLKDNSTMLIEAAKGGHTTVVQLLLDYPHSLILGQQGSPAAVPSNRESPLTTGEALASNVSQPINFFQQTPTIHSPVLQEVPDAVQILQHEDTGQKQSTESSKELASPVTLRLTELPQQNKCSRKPALMIPKNRIPNNRILVSPSQILRPLDPSELPMPLPSQSVPLNDLEDTEYLSVDSPESPNIINVDLTGRCKKQQTSSIPNLIDEGKKQQILEEIHQAERDLRGKMQSHHVPFALPQDHCQTNSASSSLSHMVNLDLALQHQQSSSSNSIFSSTCLQAFYAGATSCLQSTGGTPLKLTITNDPITGHFTPTVDVATSTYYFSPLPNSASAPLSSNAPTTLSHTTKFSSVTSHVEVSQNTAISDRPKAKPVSKKEGKHLRKQQYQPGLYGHQPAPMFVTKVQSPEKSLLIPDSLNVQGLDLDSIEQESLVLKDDVQSNLLTASLLQQFHNSPQMTNFRATFGGSPPYTTALEESMLASLTAHDLATQTDNSRLEYYVPTNTSQLPPPPTVPSLFPYNHYLQAIASMPNKDEGAIYQEGFLAGITMQQQLAQSEALAAAAVTNTTPLPSGPAQQFASVQPPCVPIPSACSHAAVNAVVQSTHHCQVPCSQHLLSHHHQHHHHAHHPHHHKGHHILVQEPHTKDSSTCTSDSKKQGKGVHIQEVVKLKKGRLMLRNQNQIPHNNVVPPVPQNQSNYQLDPSSALQQYNSGNQPSVVDEATQSNCMDLDSETESNHDTALTLACAGGHEELVELLIKRGADIEHRDKKGFTPLILSATAGHEKVVDILLNHGADIEAQSERTKDTPLSLACSGGRFEQVVELLLNRGANKEHRNVSDYTPLSLAASGGYVNIIKLLLHHAAEINSRTGSKLGISPLMLAAMNGHTAAVKLLLDMGSDINAQIETNRNTALTLACFQGRHEVVSLLLDRKANVEHRAKTGLTPLMEAASGGYVEVGRVLLDKGADVNANPVPSSRDTALTIASDKGHARFVELLLCRGSLVEVKNKKGNSPLWLAANGGHVAVVELLFNLAADIDSQDNRKVSCLMAAFRKGHVKIVEWMVEHVTQFPSDQEMIRYISTISDKELLDKTQECVNVIRAAKETQAARANKNASILLEELDQEKNREESKKAAAARRRERKKKKKIEKREEKRRLTEENKKNENYNDDDEDKKTEEEEDDDEDDKLDDEEVLQETTGSESPLNSGEVLDKEEGDSGIDANSQGSCSSNDIKTKERRKDKKKKKTGISVAMSATKKSGQEYCEPQTSSGSGSSSVTPVKSHLSCEFRDVPERTIEKPNESSNKKATPPTKKNLIFEATRHPAEREDFEATGNETYIPSRNKKTHIQNDIEIAPVTSKPSSKQLSKREEGWKEVVRKSSVQTVPVTDSGIKKVSVPLNAISRVIGRGGSNINAIRGATGAHIEVEKQSKGQGERIITIKGSTDATKQAHSLIATLIKDPDVDILQMLPKTNKTVPAATTLWDKTQLGTKKVVVKTSVITSQSTVTTTAPPQKLVTSTTPSTAVVTKAATVIKPRGAIVSSVPRVTAPRLVAQAERNSAVQLSSTSKSTIVFTTSIMTTSRPSSKVVTTTATTFAAKLTETTSSSQIPLATSQPFPSQKPRTSQTLTIPSVNANPPSPQNSTHVPNIVPSSPKHLRPTPTASAPPSMQHYQAPGKFPPFSNSSQSLNMPAGVEPFGHTYNTGPPPASAVPATSNIDTASTAQVPATTQEYSLFNSMAQHPAWRQENESHKPINFAAVTGGPTVQAPTAKFVDNEPPPQVDASKAPGYRGTAMCSPVSSKTSSSSTTPPSMPLVSSSNYHNYPEPPKNQQLPPIGTNIMHSRPVSQANQHDFYVGPEMPPSSMQHLTHSDTNLYKSSSNNYQELNCNQQHLMPSYHQQQQHHNYSQSQPQPVPSVSMSRLNPKAPDFSVQLMPNKVQPQMYNGYGMGNQVNTNPHGLTKPLPSNNYHRPNIPAPQNRWPLLQMQQPFSPQQTELISGMAGMTLHSIARAAGGEILENGGELGNVNTSPEMSPNLPPAHSMHPGEHYIEERKPQPIGTERSRKTQNPNMENNWMICNDSKMMVGRQWAGNNNVERYSMLRNHVEPEYIPHAIDPYQHGMQMENPHAYPGGAPQFQGYLLPQQQQHMPAMRPLDYVPNDTLKMELPQWETPRPNMTDIQDKPHVRRLHF